MGRKYTTVGDWDDPIHVIYNNPNCEYDLGKHVHSNQQHPSSRRRGEKGVSHPWVR